MTHSESCKLYGITKRPIKKHLLSNACVDQPGGEAVVEHCEMFRAALARDSQTAIKVLERRIGLGLEHTLSAM